MDSDLVNHYNRHYFNYIETDPHINELSKEIYLNVSIKSPTI